MQVLIHAVPARMWYVEGFLVPELRRQGAENIEIWCDREGKGNLRACMESFAARQGKGATWHLQDDVLLCRDFAERAGKITEGVAYGFCNEAFLDEPEAVGRVGVSAAWHSFQCVRIPDDYARACAAWLEGEGRDHPDHERWITSGKMDDSVFRAYLLAKHPRETVTNVAPNLVEHVDWIIGGSVLHPWRGYIARAHHWTDEALVTELKEAVRGKVQYL